MLKPLGLNGGQHTTRSVQDCGPIVLWALLKSIPGEIWPTYSLLTTHTLTLPSLQNFSFKLNVWDVGGQKSLRSYWRNYFESTDGLIWVVDSADKRRLMDCRNELDGLLLEEVTFISIFGFFPSFSFFFYY